MNSLLSRVSTSIATRLATTSNALMLSWLNFSMKMTLCFEHTKDEIREVLGMKRRILLSAPRTTGYRGVVQGMMTSPIEPGEYVNLWLFARDGKWYLQREVSFFEGNQFFVHGYFGTPETPSGSIYILRALIGRGLIDPAASKEVISLTHHEFNKYRRHVKQHNVSKWASTERV